MAKDLGISESKFYTVYKSIFNVTPNRDLITARIEKAKRLIESSNGITVKNLARECGYLNEFHFIRIFKKTVGMTPKKYAIFIRNS